MTFLTYMCFFSFSRLPLFGFFQREPKRNPPPLFGAFFRVPRSKSEPPMSLFRRTRPADVEAPWLKVAKEHWQTDAPEAIRGEPSRFERRSARLELGTERFPRRSCSICSFVCMCFWFSLFFLLSFCCCFLFCFCRRCGSPNDSSKVTLGRMASIFAYAEFRPPMGYALVWGSPWLVMCRCRIGDPRTVVCLSRFVCTNMRNWLQVSS